MTYIFYFHLLHLLMIIYIQYRPDTSKQVQCTLHYVLDFNQTDITLEPRQVKQTNKLSHSVTIIFQYFVHEGKEHGRRERHLPVELILPSPIEEFLEPFLVPTQRLVRYSYKLVEITHRHIYTEVTEGIKIHDTLCFPRIFSVSSFFSFCLTIIGTYITNSLIDNGR